jgi:hypothetical protein
MRAPVCAVDGSVASRSRPGAPEALEEAVEATEAECARRALSSRVRRLTWSEGVSAVEECEGCGGAWKGFRPKL